MKKHLTVRLPEELIKNLKEEAKKQNRTTSNIIETVLLMYVNTLKNAK